MPATRSPSAAKRRPHKAAPRLRSCRPHHHGNRNCLRSRKPAETQRQRPVEWACPRCLLAVGDEAVWPGATYARPYSPSARVPLSALANGSAKLSPRQCHVGFSGKAWPLGSAAPRGRPRCPRRAPAKRLRPQALWPPADGVSPPSCPGAAAAIAVKCHQAPCARTISPRPGSPRQAPQQALANPHRRPWRRGARGGTGGRCSRQHHLRGCSMASLLGLRAPR